MTPLSLHLLGSFQATLEGKSLTNFRTKKVQALLIYLAVEQEPQAREKLMSLLWPGLPTRSARANLRQILYLLRQIVPDLMGSHGETIPLLVANRQEIGLNPDAAVYVDVVQFEELLDRSATHNHLDIYLCPECHRGLTTAVSLYHGSFLIDFYLDDSNPFEAWAQNKRDTYRRRVLDALSILTAIALRQKAYAEALHLAERQLQVDDLSEHAYRQKMIALARNGRRQAALDVYENCRQRLLDEMAMAPSKKTTAVYQQILSGESTAAVHPTHDVRGYQLQAKIDSGAFGAIHRALQPAVGREVAIKVIRQKYANDPDFIRRFEAEAQIIARLEHPHIVPLYDYWRDPDGAYLVMRYFRAGSLLKDLRKGAWEPSRTVTLLDQISSALAAAHSQGVVHRDIKPGNILLDDDGNAYLSDFGIAKDLGRDVGLTADGTLMGSLDYISPEQIANEPITPQSDIYSLGAVLYETLTGEKPFGDAAPANLIYNHLHEPIPLVATTLPNIPPEVDTVLQKATAKKTGDRFGTVQAMTAAYHQAMRGEFTITSSPSQPVPTMADMYNPYKGLHAFREADVDDFFGRETLVNQLVARLDPTTADGGRFLAVIGPSGSGKSSVVKAGLIPALREGALPSSESWFIAEMVPGNHPLLELETALWPVAVDPPPDLLAPLQRDHGGLLRTLRRILPREDGSSQTPQLLLVIDQFEELFTLVTNEKERTFFINSLLYALHALQSPLRVVITLRADFYDRPLQRQELGQLLSAQTEIVLPLNNAELTWAICEPARRLGIRLEEGLIGAIIADVGDQPGALPLMQYALAELFDARQGNIITQANYEAIGGVAGALGQRAEALYASLSPTAQAATRQIFLRLVTLGAGIEDTRRRVLRTELDTVSTDAAQVIDTFGQARLLTFDHDPTTRQPTVEVAHEALLREWERLYNWLDESRADIRLQRLLAQATSEWLHAEKEPSFLLSGSRLQNTEDWISETSIDLTEAERQFIEASLAKHEHDIQASMLQQARERALERRSRNILALLVGIFGVATALAIGLTLFAFKQRDDAQQIRLAAQAQTALDNGEDLVLPTLLAIRSLEYGYSPEADAALLGAMGRGFTRSFVGHTDSLASIEFSPDGRYVLTASNDATARLWDAENGQEIRQFIGHTELVTRAIFSPNGQLILTGSADRTARLWDVGSGAELRRLPVHDSPIWALAFSPDGQYLISGDESGTFWLWDAYSMTQLITFKGHEDVVLSAAFSPDGQLIASASLDATARIWDAATGQEIQRFSDHAATVNSVAFSPDGSYLVTASSDNLAKVWDVTTGDAVHALLGHSNVVNDARFSPDNRWILTASYDGTVRLWDVETGREMSQYTRQTGRVNSASFSPDGEFILSGASDPIGRMWNIRNDSEPQIYPMPFRTMHSSDVVRVAFTQNEQAFVVTSGNGNELMRALDTGRVLAEWQLDIEGLITFMASAPDQMLAVTGDGEGVITFWEAQSGRAIRVIQGHQGPVWHGVFSPNGRFLVTGGEDGIARLWNVPDGAELRRFIGHKAPIQVVVLSTDGSHLLTGSDDGTAILWDIDTGLEVLRLAGHSGPVQAAALSPDNTTILTGSDDGIARLWHMETGVLIRTYLGHSEAIRVVDFVPNQNHILTGSDDGTARLWEIESGAVIRQFIGHEGPIRTWAFSKNGRYLLTAENRAVHLWQTDISDVISKACTQMPRDLTAEERLLFNIADNDLTCNGF